MGNINFPIVWNENQWYKFLWVTIHTNFNLSIIMHVSAGLALFENLELQPSQFLI